MPGILTLEQLDVRPTAYSILCGTRREFRASPSRRSPLRCIGSRHACLRWKPDGPGIAGGNRKMLAEWPADHAPLHHLPPGEGAAGRGEHVPEIVHRQPPVWMRWRRTMNNDALGVKLFSRGRGCIPVAARDGAGRVAGLCHRVDLVLRGDDCRPRHRPASPRSSCQSSPAPASTICSGHELCRAAAVLDGHQLRKGRSSVAAPSIPCRPGSGKCSGQPSRSSRRHPSRPGHPSNRRRGAHRPARRATPPNRPAPCPQRRAVPIRRRIRSVPPSGRASTGSGARRLRRQDAVQLALSHHVAVPPARPHRTATAHPKQGDR